MELNTNIEQLCEELKLSSVQDKYNELSLLAAQTNPGELMRTHLLMERSVIL